LKIERSFVITMVSDPNAMTLVSTIISLGQALRLLRCDEMQGYLFSKPLAPADLVKLLAR
jgi:EAL domain-containing protein (putative c-di-GMP-specific phosphodiesterase class I)